jgi:hypothetical protein
LSILYVEEMALSETKPPKTKPSKKTRSKIAKWKDAYLDFIVDLYVETYLRIEYGNLGVHHWQ